MRYEAMKKWEEYGSDVQFYELPGDHFYIEDDGVREKVIRLIEELENSYRSI